MNLTSIKSRFFFEVGCFGQNHLKVKTVFKLAVKSYPVLIFTEVERNGEIKLIYVNLLDFT